jgi:putative transposase
MIAFIDDHHEAHGVEPICRVLPIAPSTYHDHVAKRADPEKLSARAKRDLELKPEIERVFAENFEVYGARRSGGRWCARASVSRAAPSSG